MEFPRSGHAKRRIEMRLKAPRIYARDYINAKTKDGQIAALRGCPTHLQDLVRKHIEIHMLREEFAARQRTA